MKRKLSLASKILIGMLAGLLAGFILHRFNDITWLRNDVTDGLFLIVGNLFITLLEMLVVPIVFVSLVSGTCSIRDGKTLGRIGVKVITIFIITTAIAISIGITLAQLTHVGQNVRMNLTTHFTPPAAVTVKSMLLNLIPSNPIAAMAQGNLLQIIIFAVLFGIAISMSGDAGKKIGLFFEMINHVLMKLIEIVMLIAPYGVFCLIAVAFAKIGFNLIEELFFYFLIVLASLIIQQFGVYSALLFFFAKFNPIAFFKKMMPVMLFAFSTSSSNATIPINLEVVENELGVDNTIAAFTIPLGATINMDGTAIMQGVAAVFLAHIYHVTLGWASYLGIITTATLASIGTAGVPGVGMVTLAMVLTQAGVPLSGIGLLIGIDRLVDMLRTVVNVTGDAMTACLVAKSEWLKGSDPQK